MKMRERKLRGGVNRQGTLKQKGIKQMDLKQVLGVLDWKVLYHLFKHSVPKKVLYIGERYYLTAGVPGSSGD